MSKQSSKRDVTVVFDLHRVLRKRSPRAMLFSIFAVALLLIGPLSLVIAGIGESSADGGYVGNKMTIEYYPHKGEGPNIRESLNFSGNYSHISVTYYGDFASTEYNPQFWSLEKWYPVKKYVETVWERHGWNYIKVTYKATLFTGWVDEDNNPYDPGDIIKSGDVTGGKIKLYATWGELENYSDNLKTANDWKSGTVYTNIFVFDQINNNNTINPNYTLRGKTPDSTIDLGDKNVKGYINIKYGNNSGKTIIDNCIIKGTKGNNNHGEGDTGIFANGNKLIIGSNVKGTPDGSTEAYYAQIFGGSKTGECGPTNLIIHSGTFSNVVSGSQSGTVNGDTKVILKDVTILDTLTAGVDSEVEGNTTSMHRQ